MTSSTKLIRLVCPAPEPFSPAARALIEQVHAEARAALLNDLSAKDGITVLHALDSRTKRVRFGDDCIEISDVRGCDIDLYRRRHCPDSWKCGVMKEEWNPAYWWGRITLVDGNGVGWARQMKKMVCNDFGDLVAVEGGQP